MILAAGRSARNRSAIAAPSSDRPEGGIIRSSTTSLALDAAKRAAASGAAPAVATS